MHHVNQVGAYVLLMYGRPDESSAFGRVPERTGRLRSLWIEFTTSALKILSSKHLNPCVLGGVLSWN